MFKSPLTDDLTLEQRRAGLWVGENDHFIHLVRGQTPIEIIATFGMGVSINEIRTVAQEALKKGTGAKA